jgi:type I restriction enzyme R subunit
MPEQSRPERKTQNRVIKLFTDTTRSDCLGYNYLGEYHKKENNRCVEIDLLKNNLRKRGYSELLITSATQKLLVATDVTGITLYQANLRTYQLLRYGVSAQISAGKPNEQIQIIDWENPENNDFALAQEVTLSGGYERRPDIVLYINGIAMAVIELKRSSVDVANGIRQLRTNQEKIFNESFFSTVQLLFAGNDSQGLRYGTVTTEEEFFVQWKFKEKINYDIEGSLLDRPLAEMCEKSRLLDLIKNFIIFDAGKKKVPRPHQFEGIKAAQQRIQKREGGVIWHTQGSGKSILMVLLAKWLLEFNPNARILIVTDRDELDKQISDVMKNAGVIGDSSPSPRITSRASLVEKLGATSPRVLCALLHKFDPSDLKGSPPSVYGDFYVFVDECHRTQGGDMNRQMKRWLPNAIFIGFTGTPLLINDKQTTRDVFGTYIHTYKFHEGVADGVVLDLKYEARDVPQRITSKKAIEEYFERKTKMLNNSQRAILRRRWATMENLMSAEGRKNQIAASIIIDFDIKPRLNNDRGTAILVASSIYDACHYFRIFKAKDFGKFCGIITSYQPNVNLISSEPLDSEERYKFDTYKKFVLDKDEDTETYEDKVKNLFIKEPANMKLLIVVSKLLTGFDAPSCTYIYLDHQLTSHNLFQAICRTNRLDGDDKSYGQIVDFKKLFENVKEAIAIYNSNELDTDIGNGGSNNIELKDWLQESKKRIDKAREELKHLCEPVPSSSSENREIEQFLYYFCGPANDIKALKDTEVLRNTFYKATSNFIRAYSEIAQDLTEAGYNIKEAEELQKEVNFYSDVRSAVKNYSNEELDIKPYEADMRHLLNTYIQADPVAEIGNIKSLPLTELIVKTGIHDAIALKINQKSKLSNIAVAETIINNVRKTIIRNKLTDPKFYDEISKLLDDLIVQSRTDAEQYELFLNKAEELIKRMMKREYTIDIPEILHGNPEAIIIYNNLFSLPKNNFKIPASDTERAKLAKKIDHAVKEKAPSGWKGDQARESQVLNAIYPILEQDREATKALFDIIKNQTGY